MLRGFVTHDRANGGRIRCRPADCDLGATRRNHANENGLRHLEATLGDSDLDWGQDLLRLREELVSRGVTELS